MSLGESGTPATKLLLSERAKVETDAEVRNALRAALEQIDGRLAWGERLGVVFTGISLGSILLLVALGLAITYGLMGVINMAHGELMMIGAYATYVVQNLFRSYLPGAFDCLRAGGDPGVLPGRGRRRRGAGTRRHPLALRPAAGNAAGHLGHQPDADAGGAQPLRRAERAGGKPGLAVGRRGGDEQPDAALQPHRHHRLRDGWCWPAWPR